MSTMPTEGASFSIAWASSSVRFGRRSRSANSPPPARLMALNLATNSVLGPSSRMLLRSDWSKPRMREVIPTMAVMPMTTPSTVSPDRILLVRSVSSARKMTSRSRARRTLFPAERFNRVQAGGARRRVRAEEQPDRRRDSDAEPDRPRLEPCGQRCHRRKALGRQEPENDADHTSHRRERDRFGEHLRHDVLAAGAKRFPQTDLARALTHHHQHDVHDDDAAHEQRERD